MDLQKNSLEYAHIVFSLPPATDAVTEASIDLTSWSPVVFDASGVGKVLLRGPSCSSASGILVSSSSQLWIRVTEDPEVIVRSAGIVNIY